MIEETFEKELSRRLHQEASWYAYYHDFNADVIKPYNVMKHYSFNEDTVKVFLNSETFEEFKQQLRRKAQYYFWSKCEYEIIVKPWIERKKGYEVKIDIYDQLMLNFDAFADYVWCKLISFHTEIGKEEENGYYEA